MFFDGADVTGLPAYRIARLGAVRTFQVVRPLKDMTVFDNVLVGAFLRTRDVAQAREAASECLRLCNLEEFAAKLAGDLPIGCKKRLELARALAARPKLLMLDEVMAGLTSTEVRGAVELLRRIRDTGITAAGRRAHHGGHCAHRRHARGARTAASRLPRARRAQITADDRVISAYLGAKFSRRLQARKEGRPDA